MNNGAAVLQAMHSRGFGNTSVAQEKAGWQARPSLLQEACKLQAWLGIGIPGHRDGHLSSACTVCM